MKKLICIIFTLVIFMAISAFNVNAQESESITHEISITTRDDSKLVEETITLLGQQQQKYVNISFSIPQDATSINILFDNSQGPTPSINNGIYTYNISSLDKYINESLLVDITYSLGKDATVFEKKIVRNTKTITVSFNDKQEIYSANDLKSGSTFSLRLYKTTETPMNWFTLVMILLLVALLGVFTIYMFKKQKTVKTAKSGGVESEELLSTKKTLLMELLKDIEKQHRSKKISDDTYHKLKERYKNETVDAMKKLEDMKSKIK